jgi:hypothetical protein
MGLLIDESAFDISSERVDRFLSGSDGIRGRTSY